MKTNHLAYIVSGFLSLFVWTSMTHAIAVIDMSSGIKNQFYSLEWCSPHYARLKDNWASSCRTGYFQNV